MEIILDYPFIFRSPIRSSSLLKVLIESLGFPVRIAVQAMNLGCLIYSCSFLHRGCLHSPTWRCFISPAESQEQSEKVDVMYCTEHKALNLTPVFSDIVHPQFLLCVVYQILLNFGFYFSIEYAQAFYKSEEGRHRPWLDLSINPFKSLLSGILSGD